MSACQRARYGYGHGYGNMEGKQESKNEKKKIQSTCIIIMKAWTLPVNANT